MPYSTPPRRDSIHSGHSSSRQRVAEERHVAVYRDSDYVDVRRHGGAAASSIDGEAAAAVGGGRLLPERLYFTQVEREVQNGSLHCVSA